MNKSIIVAGTEGTGQYDAPFTTVRGVAAVRDLHNGTFRIRVEPADVIAADEIAQTLTRDAGWKQPGDNGQFRFSKVVGSGELESEFAGALKAVAGEIVAVETAPLPEVVEHLGLVREALIRGVKGANRRWSTQTLRQHVLPLRPVDEPADDVELDDEFAIFIYRDEALLADGLRETLALGLAVLQARAADWLVAGKHRVRDVAELLWQLRHRR